MGVRSRLPGDILRRFSEAIVLCMCLNEDQSINSRRSCANKVPTEGRKERRNDGRKDGRKDGMPNTMSLPLTTHFPNPTTSCDTLTQTISSLELVPLLVWGGIIH